MPIPATFNTLAAMQSTLGEGGPLHVMSRIGGELIPSTLAALASLKMLVNNLRVQYSG
jgi:hypothetical protein